MSEKAPRKPFSHEARKIDDADRSIAQRIQRRRIVVGMSKTQLANMVGITAQQVHKYETCENRVTAGTVYKLAKAMGVQPGYFYEGFGRVEPIEGKDNVARMMVEHGRELAADFIALPTAQRKMVTALARSLARELPDKDADA